MIDINKALGKYNTIKDYLLGYTHNYSRADRNVSSLWAFLDGCGFEVENIEFDGNDYDIDVSGLCVSLNKEFVVSPIFLIAVSNETELKHLGGWVSYDSGSGCLDFPFMQ